MDEVIFSKNFFTSKSPPAPSFLMFIIFIIMKRIIRLTESDLTRIIKRIIKEEEGVPAISSISIMHNMLTPSDGGKNVSVSGVLGVVNCEPNENTKGQYTVNYKQYDKKLVEQAIGSDTKIVVYSFSPGDTALNKVHEEPQPGDLIVRFVFPKENIPNLSDETMFAIFVEKGGQRIQYDGKNIATKCKAFMLD